MSGSEATAQQAKGSAASAPGRSGPAAKGDQDEGGARFDVHRLAERLPATADTMLADIYLRDCPGSSARIFRVYKPVPAHFHRSCDEYLFVLSGRGQFWTVSPERAVECAPGQLICFERDTVHSIPTIVEEPLVFLAIDAPRRDPTDVTFVEADEGSPETFMARNAAPSDD